MEDVISPTSDLDALRARIRDDRQLLENLIPGSPQHLRLQQHLEVQAGELLDAHEREERRQRVAAALAQRHRAETARRDEFLSGMALLGIGAIITYAGWGGLWMVLGIAVFLLGVAGAVGTARSR